MTLPVIVPLALAVTSLTATAAFVSLTLAFINALRHAEELHAELRACNDSLTHAEHDAHHDELTGLPNRRALIRHLNTALSTDSPVGIAIVDIDFFKNINDTHGHDTGDAALVHAARCITRNQHPGVTIGRNSGDEFLIITTGPHANILDATEQALHHLHTTPLLHNGTLIPVEANAGYVTTGDMRDRTELTRRADHALYNAKRHSDSRIRQWVPGMRMPTPTMHPYRREFRPERP